MDERQPLLHDGRPAKGYMYYEVDGKHKVVDFDPNGDSDNPMDWPKRYRWFIVFLLAFMAFTVTFTCIGIVPVANQVVLDLEGHKDKSASVLFVTIWELGEAAGPLLIASLSEILGRWPVYNFCNTLFIVGVLTTALAQDVGVVIFARFLTGCAVAGNVLNPAIVADIFPSEKRGSAMSAVMLAPLIGGAIGPTIGGVLGQQAGWRTIMYMALGLAVTAQLAYLFLFRETYKVTILQKRAARLRNDTGDDSFRTRYDQKDDESSIHSIVSTIARPFRVILGSVVLQMLSLWGALTFAFFYVMSTSLPDMLEDVYHWDPTWRGLAFLTFSIGSMLGILTNNLLSDRLFIRLRARHNLPSYPEGRLPLVITGAVLLPFVVLLYGWAPGAHWPVWTLLVIVVLMGFSMMCSIVSLLTYVTDAFGLYSASALTAVLITRCLAGTFLPLATAPLVEGFGYKGGFGIMAAACGVLAPVPALVMRYGPHWRQRSKYSRDQNSDEVQRLS